MSYIRSGSNPEKLYIYGGTDAKGRAAITLHAGTFDPKEPMLQMPPHVFYGIMLRWLHDEGWKDGTIRHRGAVFTQDPWKDGGKWVLTYDRWPKGKSIRAYHVTWSYVARNVEDRGK